MIRKKVDNIKAYSCPKCSKVWTSRYRRCPKDGTKLELLSTTTIDHTNKRISINWEKSPDDVNNIAKKAKKKAKKINRKPKEE